MVELWYVALQHDFVIRGHCRGVAGIARRLALQWALLAGYLAGAIAALATDSIPAAVATTVLVALGVVLCGAVLHPRMKTNLLCRPGLRPGFRMNGFLTAQGTG